MIGQRTVHQAADIGATLTAAVTLASHWATLLTPIATLVATILTIAWWVIRIRDWLNEDEK